MQRSSFCSGHLGRVTIGWVLCLVASPAVVAQDAPDKPPTRRGQSAAYMIENPLLREFFASQITEGRTDAQHLTDDFVDRFVDIQIESFARKMNQDLTELANTAEQVRRLRDRWVTTSGKPAKREAATAFAVKLRRLAVQSDSLADRLQAVFPDLRRNKKLDLTIEDRDLQDGYRRQLSFIDEQVSKAEQLIRDYLFRSEQTIGLSDLCSENMLTRLDWVESVAKRVAERIL